MLQFVTPAKNDSTSAPAANMLKGISVNNKIALINIYGTIEDSREKGQSHSTQH